MKKSNCLKIAIFCANEFAIPPSPKMKDIYAPLWITHYLTEELVKKGHRVTLFATSDSKTKAKLASDNLVSLAKNKKLSKFYKQVTEIKAERFFEEMVERKEIIEYYEFLLLSRFSQMVMAGEFDIALINLIGLRSLAFAAISPTPTVFILNTPLSSYNKFFLEQYKIRYPQLHYIGISKSQIKPAPTLFTNVAYHGIKLENFPFNPQPKDYYLVSGRINDEKGVYEAIQVTKKVKKKLIIIGRHTEDPYWKKKIKPNLGRNIEYKGMIPFTKTPPIYKNARALLFPIKWEEPFGLVMIEAMACGTPVIAFDRGSVREIIKDGETGFIVKNVNGMAKAIKKIGQIDRKECRKWVEQNFTVEKMVDKYEKIFLKILKKEN